MNDETRKAIADRFAGQCGTCGEQAADHLREKHGAICWDCYSEEQTVEWFARVRKDAGLMARADRVARTLLRAGWRPTKVVPEWGVLIRSYGDQFVMCAESGAYASRWSGHAYRGSHQSWKTLRRAMSTIGSNDYGVSTDYARDVNGDAVKNDDGKLIMVRTGKRTLFVNLDGVAWAAPIRANTITQDELADLLEQRDEDADKCDRCGALVDDHDMRQSPPECPVPGGNVVRAEGR